MTLLKRFRKATDGLAAVEFALILPVMITILFGLVETSLALACRTDVVNVSSAVADLVAQEASVTSSDVTNVFSAVNAILYPNDPSTAQITVTSVIYNTATNSLTSGKVDWSCTRGGTKRSKGSIVTLPANLMTANGSVIVSEINYNYASPTTQMVIGPIAMANTFYSKPRRVAAIAGPTTC
ncbi:MAG: TadE family protein [Alphaproteobacteria bacterium]|jgi:Flp pilus assembly protein TadG|nr:TadE family protein [Alphaproteobacteria bacterium]MDB5741641.1 TadE family protein [Alphaproteobacteria bacterium]